MLLDAKLEVGWPTSRKGAMRFRFDLNFVSENWRIIQCIPYEGNRTIYDVLINQRVEVGTVVSIVAKDGKTQMVKREEEQQPCEKRKLHLLSVAACKMT